MHVEQVLGNVPREERCRCRETNAKSEGQGETSSILRRFLGI